MRSILPLLLIPALFAVSAVKSVFAEADFPLTEDSKPHDGIPKGQLIKGSYTAKEGSVFPGTEREYTIYLPPRGSRFDDTLPYAFMVFQDGVIYQAPTVFDNLIAKREIPPLAGIFIKPGVVPAANQNALPRYNRSYEYDSVTDTYSRFLIEEFLPAIESRHKIKLSTNPNDAAISGNSSGGICAFMVAWHRPDRFRRVFSGVGTYVGIHGADQLPVLVRKYEPKPLRVFLQSGTNDNNLYCGDWWMANQTMERALTWAGYDVNHAWGEGGHNQKHASQIFPAVLRWLWRDFSEPAKLEVKANPRGESKCVGFGVVGEGKWETAVDGGGAWPAKEHERFLALLAKHDRSVQVSTTPARITSTASGDLFAWLKFYGLCRIRNGKITRIPSPFEKGSVSSVHDIWAVPNGKVVVLGTVNENGSDWPQVRIVISADDSVETIKTLPNKEDGNSILPASSIVCLSNGTAFGLNGSPSIYKVDSLTGVPLETEESRKRERIKHGPDAGTLIGPEPWDSKAPGGGSSWGGIRAMTVSPDQTLFYLSDMWRPYVYVRHIQGDGSVGVGDRYCQLESSIDSLNPMWSGRMCVDTNGWLYVATALGIQVCDQAGRVNFIIPTPQQPHDVCFGGKELSELFIACGDKIYKRQTKAHGIVSGQMPPIKPPGPKL